MISIESADPDQFREIRGGILAKVIKGIKLLIHEKKSKNSIGPRVGFAATILKRTMKDFSSIVALYDELQMDGGIAIQFLQEMPTYTGIYSKTLHDDILNEEEIRLFKLSVIKNPASRKFLSASKIDSFYEGLFSQEKYGCPWLAKGLYLNTNGMATGCCQIKERRFGFGVLTKATIEDISLKREQLQSRLLSGNIPEACSRCHIATSIQKRLEHEKMTC
jgi:MoaA/NifB/PqqE/SkfB family radical SAM enzyme